MRSIFRDIWKSVFGSDVFSNVPSHKRATKKNVGDKYNVNTFVAGKQANELYIVLDPRDGEYLTGKMDKISNQDRQEFKDRLSESRQKSTPSRSHRKPANNEMQYYLNIIDKDLIEASQDLFDTQYRLCKRSFGTVYPQDGMRVLNTVIMKHSESYHDSIEIVNQDGDQISFDEFATMLDENTVLDA